jgi:hypothetical protein
MAFQFSVAARNAALDAIETAAGTGPTLTIRTGAVPANCGAARTGTVLATLVLPSDWLAAASGGSKTRRSFFDLCGRYGAQEFFRALCRVERFVVILGPLHGSTPQCVGKQNGLMYLSPGRFKLVPCAPAWGPYVGVLVNTAYLGPPSPSLTTAWYSMDVCV